MALKSYYSSYSRYSYRYSYNYRSYGYYYSSGSSREASAGETIFFLSIICCCICAGEVHKRHKKRQAEQDNENFLAQQNQSYIVPYDPETYSKPVGTYQPATLPYNNTQPVPISFDGYKAPDTQPNFYQQQQQFN